MEQGLWKSNDHRTGDEEGNPVERIELRDPDQSQEFTPVRDPQREWPDLIAPGPPREIPIERIGASPEDEAASNGRQQPETDRVAPEKAVSKVDGEPGPPDQHVQVQKCRSLHLALNALKQELNPR